MHNAHSGGSSLNAEKDCNYKCFSGSRAATAEESAEEWSQAVTARRRLQNYNEEPRIATVQQIKKKL